MNNLICLIKNFKRTKIWYNLLLFLIFPIYSIIWQFLINFHGKFLYYLWFYKKRKQFDIKDNFSLIIKNDLEFSNFANLINSQYSESKIEYIVNNKKIQINTDLLELEKSLKESCGLDIILDFDYIKERGSIKLKCNNLLEFDYIINKIKT